MWPDRPSAFDQFEREGEHQVRRKLADHSYNSAEAYANAASWLEQKDRQRAQQQREERRRSEEAWLVAERQVRAAESAYQLGEQQLQQTVAAIRQAKEANRLSRLAIAIGIASLIVALVVAIFK